MPVPRSSTQVPNTNNSGRSASPDEDDDTAWPNHHRHVTFRQIKKLSDAYIFSDPQDVIGSGAFSTVYRCRRVEPGPGNGDHHACPAEARASGHQNDSHPPRVASTMGMPNSNSSTTSSSSASSNSEGLSPAHFAIKVIRRSKLSVTEKRAQLREVDREVCVIQQLQHTGCTAFVEALQTSDEFAIVMDLREGAVDLAKYLRQFGPLAEDHAAAVVCQLLHTAQYLHRWFRVLHRDIKLENIILSPVPDDSEASGHRGATAGGGGRLSPNSSVGAEGQRGGSAGRSQVAEAREKSDGDTAAGIDSKKKSAASAHGSPERGSDSSGNSATSTSATTSTDNVLQHLKRFGHVTLVDFGLARWLPPLPNSMAVPDNRSHTQQQDQTAAASNGCLLPNSSSSASQHSPAATAPSGTTMGCHSRLTEDDRSTLLHRFDTASSAGHSAAAVSPISPVQFGSGHLPTFVVSPRATQEDEDEIPSDDPSSDASTMIYVSCCGSDKYLAHEMLKWYVESSSGRGSRRCMTVEHATKLDVYAVGVVAYVLLSGCLPYSGRTKALLAQQQATSPLKMTSQHWAGVSQEAKDFVASLLSMDVGKRPTPEKALAHPWLQRAHALCEKLHTVPHSLVPLSHGGGVNGRAVSTSPLQSAAAVPPNDHDSRFSPLRRAASIPEVTAMMGASSCRNPSTSHPHHHNPSHLDGSSQQQQQSSSKSSCQVYSQQQPSPAPPS